VRPVKAKYTSKWHSIPFVRFGVAYQKFLQKKAGFEYTVSEGTSSKSGTYLDINFSDYQCNVFLAAGADVKLRKNRVLLK